MQWYGVSFNILFYFYILTNGCNFSPVFSNCLNYHNASSNSLSYTFISLKWFSSHMSPPMDRGTSRSSPIGNTLFFTIYQITLCVLQMKLLLFYFPVFTIMLMIYHLPWIDHTSISFNNSICFCRLQLIQHLFRFYQWINIFLHQSCHLQYVELPLCHSW